MCDGTWCNSGFKINVASQANFPVGEFVQETMGRTFRSSIGIVDMSTPGINLCVLIRTYNVGRKEVCVRNKDLKRLSRLYLVQSSSTN